jgi:hypothetical protein
MKKFTFSNILILFGFMLFGIACQSENNGPLQPIPVDLDKKYKFAVDDATIMEESELFSALTPINDENPNLIWQGTGADKRLLVVSLVKYKSSYPVGDTVSTWWGETWITVAPEIKSWFKGKKITMGMEQLRAEQLLGLPYNSGNNWAVEMWVKPSDLYRPSYDNEITDTKVELHFPPNTDSTYIKWFNDNIVSSYYPALNKKAYPWTRLGYTYDWGNPYSEIGLSEFVVKKNSKIIVKTVSAAPEYLR